MTEAKMTDWPVMSDKEIQDIVFECGLTFTPPLSYLSEELTSAQAKHTGELAAFIIALVISLVHKKEREGINMWAFEDCDCQWRARNMRVVKSVVKKKNCPYCWEKRLGDKGE